MLEKIRRQDKVEVDMAIVKKLKRYQKKMNDCLKSSQVRCTLHPKPDLYPCNACLNYKACEAHKKERDYINGEMSSYTTSKRRKQKDERNRAKSEDTALEAKEVKYPCEPFDFCCPIKDKCNKGQSCPWKD